MPNQDINIRIKLTDEITRNLKKASQGLKDFSLDMRKVGREISYVGMSMTAVGASIVAPLTLAYKQAGKFNAEIAHQLRETQNVFDNLSVSIGKSLLPVMKRLTDSVANAVSWWNSLDQSMRDKVIQSIWNTGKALVALGLSLVVIGKTISTLANLGLLLANLPKLAPIFVAMTGPIGWATIAFAGLIFVMIKFKKVREEIMNLAQAVPRGVAWLMGMSQEDIDQILGKQGAWAKAGDDFIQQFTDFANTYKKIMGSLTSGGEGAEGNVGNIWTGFKTGLDEALANLSNWAETGKKIALDMTSSMQTSFTNLFDDAFSGELKRAEDYFAEFGRSLLHMFSQTIAQMITKWIMFGNIMGEKNSSGGWGGILGSVLSLFGGNKSVTVADAGGSGFFGGGATGGSGAGGSFHNGGIIRAHSGLSVGEVPIIAQSGERVLSRAQNRAYERGGQSQNPVVVFIQAWDAQDVMRNRKSIESVIINALKNNSSVRGAVKTYG
jgi:hypothetical protein